MKKNFITILIVIASLFLLTYLKKELSKQLAKPAKERGVPVEEVEAAAKDAAHHPK